MNDHFRLDVAPDTVETAARRLARTGALLEDQSGALGRAGTDVAPGWRGAAATSATIELAGLSRELTRSAPHFATVQRALVSLALVYREAEQAVGRLNRRWEQAKSDHAAALVGAANKQAAAVRDIPPGLPSEDRVLLRQDAENAADDAAQGALTGLLSEQRALEQEFQELRADLQGQTTRAGAAAAQAILVPVPAAVLQLALTARILGGWSGSLYPSLDASATFASTLPLADLERRLSDPPGDLPALQALLDAARAAGLTPRDYQLALKRYWTATAMLAAGIDPAGWDPSLGAAANREIVEQVYTYYGQLYADSPHLLWAAMANMIGPSFAAGFFDLNLIQRYADAYGRTGAPGLPAGMSELAHATAADLRFYEMTFLGMQKDIFVDQASMHEAYERGGLDAIREMAEAGIFDRSTLRAWELIDQGRQSGDWAAIAAGNKGLLRREQFDIVADSYDEMRAHPGTGEAMTFMMTLVGGPSIPGAQSFPDVFPLRVEVATPGPDRVGTPRSVFGIEVPHLNIDNPLQGTVTIQTPFPAGNIADRVQRWELIEQDTLPAFLELLRTDPERAAAIIQRPVSERIEEYHLYSAPRVLEDAEHLLTHWDAEFEQ